MGQDLESDRPGRSGLIVPRHIYPNFATTPLIAEWARDHVPQMCRDARRERQTLNTRWQHFNRMHQVELKDEDMAYRGRSRVYLPATRRAIESWQTVLFDALWPAQGEKFSVDGVTDITSPDQVPRWHALQKRYLEEMGLEDELPLFLRNYLTVGWSWMRHVFDYDTEPHRVWERQFRDAPLDTDREERRIREMADPHPDPELTRADGTVFRLVEKLIETSGPICRAVDWAHAYVAPMTARSLDDATLAFEDIEVPFTYVEQQHERWMDPQEAAWGRVYDHPKWADLVRSKGLLTDDMLREERERYERLGIDPDTNRVFTSLAAKGHAQITEAFWKGEIVSKEGEPAKDEDGTPFGVRDWHFIIVNDCFVVRAHPNLHYTNRRPWVDGRMYRTTRSYYAQGVCDAVASLQLVANDTLNLTLDGMNLALSPPTVVDPGEMLFPEQLEFAPGAIWLGKKDAVQPLTVPSPTQLGMLMLQTVETMVQAGADANFAVQGRPPVRGSGRAAQSAQGMAQYAAAGSQGMLGFARALTRQALVPILERNYDFTTQFQTERQTIQRLGPDGVSLVVEQVGIEDILGGYRYKWHGAEGVREKAMTLGMLQQLPMQIQQLAMFDPSLPQKFDAEKFLRRMLQEANIAGVEEFFRTPLAGTSVAPDLELEAFKAHRAMPVHPGDDDQAHMQAHQLALFTDDTFLRDPIARKLLLEHIQATVAQIQAKMAAQAMQAMQAMMQPPPGAEGPAAPPGQGSPPALAGPEPAAPMGGMNPTDLMKSASAGVL